MERALRQRLPAADQAGNVFIDGGMGADFMFAANPASVAHIEGHDGDDTIAGHLLGDQLSGDNGNDVVTGSWAYYPAAPGGQMTPFEPSEADVIFGEAGTDGLYGFDGDDVIHGGSGHDIGTLWVPTPDTWQNGAMFEIQAGLFGGDGNDQLFGEDGKDLLAGGNGNDKLNGGERNDVVFGGEGADNLRGGGGADIFAFDFASESRGARRDVITDFSHRQHDGIGLYWMDAKTDKPGNQAFHYIGDHGFTGDLRRVAFCHARSVSGDVDGDGNADFRITVEGVKELNDWEFIL